MENIEKKIVIIGVPFIGLAHAAILAETMASAQRGITIVTVDNDTTEEALQNIASMMEPVALEMKPLEITRLDVEPLTETSVLMEQFSRNEALMQSTQKRHMKSYHTNQARNALKYTRKPPGFQSRKF